MNLYGNKISNFKQININNYFILNKDYPDIEDINDVNGTIEVINCYTIKTSEGVSTEGQMVKENKVIINGVLKFTCTYVACNSI